MLEQVTTLHKHRFCFNEECKILQIKMLQIFKGDCGAISFEGSSYLLQNCGVTIISLRRNVPWKCSLCDIFLTNKNLLEQIILFSVAAVAMTCFICQKHLIWLLFQLHRILMAHAQWDFVQDEKSCKQEKMYVKFLNLQLSAFGPTLN